METAAIKKIKDTLPRGAQATIAKKANVTPVTVYHVMQGKSQNQKVFDAIIEYWKEREAKQQIFNNILQGALN